MKKSTGRSVMPPITDSATVRSDMVRALRLDLVGPGTGDEAHAQEGLPQAPSRWYLTGFLVPLGAPEQQRAEIAADDELDTIDEAGGSDDAVTPEPGPARRAFLPSSMGLSVLGGPDVDVLDVVVSLGRLSPRKWRPGGGRDSGGAQALTPLSASWLDLPCNRD
jgi:hypothetical protein